MGVNLRAALRRNGGVLGYGVALGVMPLVFSSVVVATAIRHADRIQGFGIAEWTITFVATCFTMAFALTPTTIVALASGFFLGWTAIPLLIASYSVASVLGYGAARFVDGGRLLATIARITGKSDLAQRLSAGGWLLVASSRLSPILPFAVMNLVLSALKIPLPTFVLAGLVGMMPRTLVSVWIGLQFGSIAAAFRNADSLPMAQISVVVLTAASIAGLVLYFRQLSRHTR